MGERTDELVAPSDWRTIDFISDLHLHAGEPATRDLWRAYLERTPAPDALFILGDLFEVWVGDDVLDHTDTPERAFVHDCVVALHRFARHKPVFFMAGNRDFLVGPALLADAGVERLHDPTLLRAFGGQWLLTHGDALCLEDVEYQAFRRTVRDAAWQQAFLARPIDERTGIARAIRSESRAHQSKAPERTVWADVDAEAACHWLDAAGSTTLIHGHTHRPGEHVLGGAHRRFVLSDWDLESTPGRADLLRLDAGGLQRRAPIGCR